MRVFLIILFQIISSISLAQSGKALNNKNIEDRVNSIYLANTIQVKSINVSMNSNMETNYKIVLYNGRNKKVIAVELSLNFNAIAGQNNSDEIITKKFKVSISPKSNTSLIFYKVTLTSLTKPSTIINSVVYSDGTFEDNDGGLYSDFQEEKEKAIIRKKLLSGLIK